MDQSNIWDQATTTGRIECFEPIDLVERGAMDRGAKIHVDLVASLDLRMNRRMVISERLRPLMSVDPFIDLNVGNFGIVEIKRRIHHKTFRDDCSKMDFPVYPLGTTLY